MKGMGNCGRALVDVLVLVLLGGGEVSLSGGSMFRGAGWKWVRIDGTEHEV